jgi:hypothetical protein
MEINDKEKYDYLFTLADSDQDGVIGLKDATFLNKSGLSRSLLGQIWELVAAGKPALSREEFYLALKLIFLAQSGKNPTLLEAHSLGGFPVPKFEGVEFPRKKPPFEWRFTEQMKSQYVTYFESIDTDRDGLIDIKTAKEFFLQSKLPKSELGQIWELAKVTDSPQMNFVEFCLALFLVRARLSGQELPVSLPPSLLTSVTSLVGDSHSSQSPEQKVSFPVTSSPVVAPSLSESMFTAVPRSSSAVTQLQTQSPWWVSPQQRAEYESHFRRLTNNSASYVTGAQAREFFSMSRLPNDILARIYTMADIDKDGVLDLIEFSIAMHLIHKILSGLELPSQLPEPLLNSLKVTVTSTVPLPTLNAATLSDPFFVTTRDVFSAPVSGPSSQPSSPFPTTVASPGLSPSHSQQITSFDSERLKPIELDKQRLQEEKLRLEQLRTQTEMLKIQQQQYEEQRRLEEQLKAKKLMEEELIKKEELRLQEQREQQKRLQELMQLQLQTEEEARKREQLKLQQQLEEQKRIAEQIRLQEQMKISEELKRQEEIRLKQQQEAIKLQHQQELLRLEAIKQQQILQAQQEQIRQQALLQKQREEALRQAQILAEQQEQIKKQALIQEQLKTQQMLQEAERLRLLKEEELKQQRLQQEQEAIRQQQLALQKQEELRQAQLRAQQEETLKQQKLLETQKAIQQQTLLQQQMILEEQRRQKQEEERREIEKLKQQATQLLKNKENLIAQLRESQQRHAALEKAVQDQDAEIDALKQEVKKLELEVEKQRIKSASIKEKIQFARNQLQTIHEQKEQFDRLVKQKTEQYNQEKEQLETMEKQLEENRQNLEKQRASIAQLKKLKEDLLAKQKSITTQPAATKKDWTSSVAADDKQKRADDSWFLSTATTAASAGPNDFSASSSVLSTLPSKSASEPQSASPPTLPPKTTPLPATSKSDILLAPATVDVPPSLPPKNSLPRTPSSASTLTVGNQSATTDAPPPLPPKTKTQSDIGKAPAPLVVPKPEDDFVKPASLNKDVASAPQPPTTTVSSSNSNWNIGQETKFPPPEDDFAVPKSAAAKKETESKKEEPSPTKSSVPLQPGEENILSKIQQLVGQSKTTTVKDDFGSPTQPRTKSSTATKKPPLEDDFFTPLSPTTTKPEDDFFKPIGATGQSAASATRADDFKPFDKPLFPDQKI